MDAEVSKRVIAGQKAFNSIKDVPPKQPDNTINAGIFNSTTRPVVEVSPNV